MTKKEILQKIMNDQKRVRMKMVEIRDEIKEMQAVNRALRELYEEHFPELKSNYDPYLYEKPENIATLWEELTGEDITK